MLSKWLGWTKKYVMKTQDQQTNSSAREECGSHDDAVELKWWSRDHNDLLDVVSSASTEQKKGQPIVENDERTSSKPLPEETVEVKVYKIRFWILLLFSLCSMMNGMQWAQYVVVADITMCFYGVDISAVYWTSTLYLLIYPILVLPVSWFMNHMGLRTSMLIGACCNFLSTILQCISLIPEGFAFVLTSQAVSAIGQVFILPGPPFLAALWFGEKEVSRACAMAVFGNQLGGALGFVFTPLVVTEDCTKISTIAYQKGIVAYTLVGFNMVVFLLISGTFRDKPNSPPSLAQARKAKITTNYKEVILKLSKNLHFNLLLIMYGLTCGVFFAVAAMLNPLILPYFPGKDQEIGWMGLIATVVGCSGSVIAGLILDWIHKFKLMTTVIFALTLLSLVVFTGLLRVNQLWIQFITVAAVGFFLLSYFPVGFEFAAEITYPLPESITGSLLNASTMIFGFVITLVGSTLLENYGDLVANIFLCGIIFTGFIVSVFVKCENRRSAQCEEPGSNLEQTRDDKKKFSHKIVNRNVYTNGK